MRRVGLRDVEHRDAAPAAHVGVVALEVHPGGAARNVSPRAARCSRSRAAGRREPVPEPTRAQGGQERTHRKRRHEPSDLRTAHLNTCVPESTAVNHTRAGGERRDRRPAGRACGAARAGRRESRTRPAPTAAPPRRSAPRRPRSPSWCAPGACASCAGSARVSRRACASWSRRADRRAGRARARARSRPRRAGPLPRPERQAVGGAGPRARRAHRRRAARGGRRGPAARACPASARRPRRSCWRRSPARATRGPRQGLMLNRAWELVGGIAAALDGEVAGDVRRWRDSCELLAVVCAAADAPPCSPASPTCPRSSRSSSERSAARWA